MKRRISEIKPPAMGKEGWVLKEELQRLAKEIIEGDDYGMGLVEEAIKSIYALKEFKFRKITSFYSKRKVDTDVPQEFLCPISGELMKDPVIVASGETYDRKFIERWFSEVNVVCPRTKQVLNNTNLTPNSLVQKIIRKWCKENRIELPKLDPDEEEVEEMVVDPPRADRARLVALLEQMSSPSLSVQKEAAKEIRMLTVDIPGARELLLRSSSDVLQLLNPLLSGSDPVDPGLREDLITAVYHISIPMSNKKKLADCPATLPVLNESLVHGTIESRGSAAAALGTLANLKTYDLLIGISGSMKNLINLLKEGEELAISDANQTIYVLCRNVRNREKAIEEGLVWVVLEKIMNRVCVEELLPMLSGHAICSDKGIEEMMRHGAVPLLLELLGEERWSDGVREKCVVIVLFICVRNESSWKEVEAAENRFGTVSRLSKKGGTQRTKAYAAVMLKKLKLGTLVLPRSP